MAKIIDLDAIRAQRKHQDLDDLLDKVRTLDMAAALLSESKKDADALAEILKAFQNDPRLRRY